MGMVFVHEVHDVNGRCEDEFDAAYRDRWLPAVAQDPGMRVLYGLHLAHGSGPSYRFITITALRDGTALGRLVDRTATGDLKPLAEELDTLRHDVHAKTLVALPWSRFQGTDLSAVPIEADHDPVLYMEDTVWPHEGRLEDYVERSGNHYAAWMDDSPQKTTDLLRIEAAFRTTAAGGTRREIVLWQRVVRPEWISGLLLTEIPPKFKAPGTWMHDGLEVRDQWQSRLLRTARWSPFPLL